MRNINKKREKNKQQKKRNKRTKWKKYTGFVVLGNIKKIGGQHRGMKQR